MSGGGLFICASLLLLLLAHSVGQHAIVFGTPTLVCLSATHEGLCKHTPSACACRCRLAAAA